MDVSVSGAVLASLLFEHGNADNDLDGFLLGQIANHVTDTISDSQINNLKEQTTCYINAYVPCKEPFSWYDNVGRVVVEKLKKLLPGDKHKHVVGWFKFRRNSTMVPSLREKTIHHQLLDCFTGILPKNFLYFLCTPQQAANKATHSMDHVFQVYNGRRFEGIPMKVVNLGETRDSQYKLQGCKTTNPSQGMFGRTVYQARDEFLTSSGQMHSVICIDSLHSSLYVKLQELCNKVASSEQQLQRARQEVEALHLQMNPKPKAEVKPAYIAAKSGATSQPGDSNFTPVKSNSALQSQAISAKPSTHLTDVTSSHKSHPTNIKANLKPPEKDLISLGDSDEDVGPRNHNLNNGNIASNDNNTNHEREFLSGALSRSDNTQPRSAQTPRSQLQATADNSPEKQSNTNQKDQFAFVKELISKTNYNIIKPQHSSSLPGTSASVSLGTGQQSSRPASAGCDRVSQEKPMETDLKGSKSFKNPKQGVAEAIELSSDEDQTQDMSFSNSPVF